MSVRRRKVAAWAHSAVFALVCCGCISRKSVDDSVGDPRCLLSPPDGFTPVTEPELRLDVATALWDGDLIVQSAGSGVAWDGQGAARTELYLNRGMSYRIVGSMTCATPAELTLVQRLESGRSTDLASWTCAPGVPLEMEQDVIISENGNRFTLALDQPMSGAGAVELQITGQQWADMADVVGAAPVLLGFLMHIEEAPELVTDADNWRRRASVVESLSRTLAAHGAALTLQPGQTFVEGAAVWDPNWFSARAAEGTSWSVHVHNEADGAEALEKAVRTARHDFSDAGLDVRDLNGGFSLGIWNRMAASGMQSVTAFKNPDTQLDLAVPRVQPWRPSEGSGASDEAAFGLHDPHGPVVYLPGSGVREADHTRFGAYAQRHLAQVRAHAVAGFVNTWYFMEHVDGFGPDVSDPDFDAYLEAGLAVDMAEIDAALATVVDPLVSSGQVQYGTPDTMRAAYAAWETDCAVR